MLNKIVDIIIGCHLFLATKIKQLSCRHPVTKRYRTLHQIRCYDCNKRLE